MSDPSIMSMLAAFTALIGLATALLHFRVAQRGTVGSSGGSPAPLDASLGVQLRQGQASLPSLPGFVNREAELADAMDRIRAGDVVISIEGDDGIGKSATAMELARRLRHPEYAIDGMPDFGDHTFLWIACDGGCPTLQEICADLARLTGDQSLSAVADAEKLNALRIHMSLRKTVLVFDDLRLSKGPDSEAIRQLVEAVPEGSLVIASLDRPRELRASRVTLRDLELSHVVELIQNQVRTLGLQPAGDFDEQLAERLRDTVGGNPGEIDWVLSSFDQGHRPLEDHLAAIERGEMSRQESAEFWSDLSPRDRTALAACAYLEGSTTAELLGAACDLSEDEVSSALQALVRLGLVIPVHNTDVPSNYTCSARVSRLALSKLSPETEVAFTDRLVDRLQRHFAESPEDARAAIPYVGSLRPVMARLQEQGNDPDLHALFKASLDILFTLGRFDDRIELGRIAYESAMAAGNHSGASLAAEVLSSTHAARGEIERAREALGWGELAAERSGALADRVRQRRCDALIAYRSGEAELALELSEGLDRLAREAGDLECLVNVLDHRAAASRYLGAFDDSRAAAEECLRVCEEMPWFRAIAYPLRDLAEAAIHEGRFPQARKTLRRARTVATDSEDRRQLARIALTEARMHLLESRLGEARKAAASAQSEAARLGLPPEATEAAAIYHAARFARLLPPLRFYYRWARPRRLTAAPA